MSFTQQKVKDLKNPKKPVTGFFLSAKIGVHRRLISLFPDPKIPVTRDFINRLINIHLQLQIPGPYSNRMELSEKRLAANRANAKRSTGPKSISGRRNSARNGLRHGILAKAVVIDGESHEAFLELLASITAEYQPATDTEDTWVDKAATAQWRYLRTVTIESAAITYEMRRQAITNSAEDSPTRAMLAMRSLSDNSRNPELMRRYEQCFDTQYHRAIKALNAIHDQKSARKNSKKTTRTHLKPAE
jgi:hypothetical protein